MTEKTRLRRDILAARDAESDREAKSAVIGERLRALADYRSARTVVWYAGVGSEVATLPLISRALAEGQHVGLPYVDGRVLGVARIEHLDELAAAPFGLLEPAPALRTDRTRRIAPDAVDLFVVPGVAFDRSGGRLGHGRGYYDRLLTGASSAARFIAVAFECQLVDRVPMTATDVRMHGVVTEGGVYGLEPGG